MSAIPLSQAERLDPRIAMPRPSVDPLIAPAVNASHLPEKLDLKLLRGEASGSGDSPYVFNAEVVINEWPQMQHTEHQILGPDGNTITLSVFAPKNPSTAKLPAMYHIHGGGQVAGTRFVAVSAAMKFLPDMDFVVVSVEYRLSPETKAPGPAMDCHAGLVWMSTNASVLGIDPAQIVVYGISGGGPLAAATCLIARDKKTPSIPIKAQMLLTPMLDDRCESVSDRQFEYGTTWCGATNRMAWDHVLGKDRGTDKVTPYQSPSRATDLSNLPPTYIDAAECEVFRDPAVVYAMSTWRCGSTCELHIWPGAYHGFEILGESTVPLVQMAILAKCDWLKRIFRGENAAPKSACFVGEEVTPDPK